MSKEIVNSGYKNPEQHSKKSLGKKVLPLGLSVVLGLGALTYFGENKNSRSTEENSQTPHAPAIEIIPPSKAELIPLAKPGDDKVELIPPAKPENTNPSQQS